jgi:hypothetical protein
MKDPGDDANEGDYDSGGWFEADGGDDSYVAW